MLFSNNLLEPHGLSVEKPFEHVFQSRIWGSTLVADGKVYIGIEDGDLVTLKAGKEKKLLAQIDFGAPLYSSAIVAKAPEAPRVSPSIDLTAITGNPSRPANAAAMPSAS